LAVENVCPAIVAVPERDPPVLGATFRTTTPLPEPEAPDLTVTQPTLLTAVQGTVLIRVRRNHQRLPSNALIESARPQHYSAHPPFDVPVVGFDAIIRVAAGAS
jgi:hypothetical protein